MDEQEEMLCTCVEPDIYRLTLYTTVFLYGAIVAIMFSLIIESIFWLVATSFLMSVIIAPIVEEFLKTAIVFYIRRYIYLLLITSLGFGVGEMILHAILGVGGFLSLTPLFHVAFVLPMYFIYHRYPTKKGYMVGYLIGVTLHALYNYSIITYGGV